MEKINKEIIRYPKRKKKTRKKVSLFLLNSLFVVVVVAISWVALWWLGIVASVCVLRVST